MVERVRQWPRWRKGVLSLAMLAVLAIVAYWIVGVLWVLGITVGVIDFEYPGVVGDPTLDSGLVYEDPLLDLPVEAGGEDELLGGGGTGELNLRRTVHGVSFDEYLRVLSEAQGLGVVFYNVFCDSRELVASGRKRTGPYILPSSVAYHLEDRSLELRLDARRDQPEVDAGAQPDSPARGPDIGDECPPELLDAFTIE